MSEPSDKIKTYHYNNPMETFPGLTIDDLNRYLPAIQTVEDMSMTLENLQEGIFLAKCIDGLKNYQMSRWILLLQILQRTIGIQRLDLGMEILFRNIINGISYGYKNHIVF